MKQIILIGFSTTGKSTLINKIVAKFPHREKLDTDEEISKGYDKSISNIYYSNTRIEETYKLINRLEENLLQALKISNDNLVIAAGPGIPFKETFTEYILCKNPHVILIEKPAEKIYESLVDRRNQMKKESKHNRPDFGIWDIGVMVDRELVEYSKEDAIKKIQFLLDERQEYYNRYATLKISSKEIFSENLPKSLLGII